MAVGDTRLFIGSSRAKDQFDYSGDVFAVPKTGGTPTVLVADSGVQTHLAADGDELLVLAATSRSGSQDMFRLDRIGATGASTSLTSFEPNCTNVAVDADSAYLACLGRYTSGSSAWPSSVVRFPRAGASQVIGEMNTVYSVATDSTFVYWIGSESAGIQRRRKDLSAATETLGPTEYALALDYQIDPASSTAWWSQSGSVKRFHWKTKEATNFATESANVCGIAVTAGAAMWVSCDSSYNAVRMYFMPIGDSAPKSWETKATGAFTVDANYIYWTEGTQILRMKRPDR